MINRTPAKCNGLSYSKPSFIPAYAVDHNRQAMIAQKIVLPLLFKKKILEGKYQKKNIQINDLKFELCFYVM
jgi:hypothetical protein